MVKTGIWGDFGYVGVVHEKPTIFVYSECFSYKIFNS